MQIIEVTDFGVRTAVMYLQRRDSPMRFVIFPMVHLGKVEFYSAVTARLSRCDLAVVEGVAGRRSVLVSALTSSYRIARFNRRVDVTVQCIDYGALGIPIVRPDLDAKEFTKSWRRIPLAHRLMVWAILPVVLVMRLVGGSSWIWSRAMELNDLPTDEEQAIEDDLPALNRTFLHDRDDRLLAALSRLHDEHRDEKIDIAVVYGAGHVPAVVHGMLRRYGYRPRDAEWLTVADL